MVFIRGQKDKKSFNNFFYRFLFEKLTWHDLRPRLITYLQKQ